MGIWHCILNTWKTKCLFSVVNHIESSSLPLVPYLFSDDILIVRHIHRLCILVDQSLGEATQYFSSWHFEILSHMAQLSYKEDIFEDYITPYTEKLKFIQNEQNKIWTLVTVQRQFW